MSEQKKDPAAVALGRKGGLKGGRARMDAMAPEDRAELGRKGATSRWSLPRATHTGLLKIGELELPCSVLTTGERVLSQIGFYTAVTGSTSVSGRPKSDSGDLPVYLAAKNLKPFISDELAAAVSSRILFLPKNPGAARGGGNVVHGIAAKLIPEICDVWLKARAAGALYRGQTHIAARAELLVRGLAVVGITALVDEVTGYQADRARDELNRILEAYIAEELRPWVKLFPDEFFRQIYRLRQWDYKEGNTKGPRFVGKLINRYVYDQLPPGVPNRLRELNPVVTNGRRRHRHHQFLTDHTGEPHLDKQITVVTTLMRVASDQHDFEAMFRRAFPRSGEQQLIRYEGLDEEE